MLLATRGARRVLSPARQLSVFRASGGLPLRPLGRGGGVQQPLRVHVALFSAAATKRDYYEVLGCSKDAPASEIKKKFVALAKKLHPDQNKGNKDAAKQFQEVAEAWEVLGDEEKRKTYDQGGHQAVDGQHSHGGMGGAGMGGGDPFRGMEHMFGNLFGNMRTANPDGPELGETTGIRVPVSLQEALRGGKKTVSFRAMVACEPCKGSGVAANAKPVHKPCATCGGRGVIQQNIGGFGMAQMTCPACAGARQMLSNTCASCRGEGRVPGTRTITLDIPPGADDDNVLTVRGQGSVGRRNGPPGDVQVEFEMEKSREFVRDGVNVHTEVGISFAEAILGGLKTTRTLESEVELKIPPGTQPNSQVRLRGKGFPDVRRPSRRGDQLISFRVDLPDPSKLTARQRELLREFDAAAGSAAGKSKAAAAGEQSSSASSTSSTSSASKAGVASDEDKSLFGRLKEKLTGTP